LTEATFCDALGSKAVIVGSWWAFSRVCSSLFAVVSLGANLSIVGETKSRSVVIGCSIAHESGWAWLTSISVIERECAWNASSANIDGTILNVVLHIVTWWTVVRHFGSPVAHMFAVARDGLTCASWAEVVDWAVLLKEVGVFIAELATGASDWHRNICWAVLTWAAFDRSGGTLWTIGSNWAILAIFLIRCTVLINIASWWAWSWISGSFWAEESWWALSSIDCNNSCFITIVAFLTDNAVVGPDLLWPWVVGASGAVILILFIVCTLSVHWAVLSFGALIVVTASPFADISWLASSAVTDLTSSSLHTHGLIWTQEWNGDTTRAVMADGAFI
jgi:hypothetical protein